MESFESCAKRYETESFVFRAIQTRIKAIDLHRWIRATSYVSIGSLFLRPCRSSSSAGRFSLTLRIDGIHHITSSTMRTTPTDTVRPIFQLFRQSLRREATSTDYRLYLDFESRVIEHGSISSSIFELYRVRYFKDALYTMRIIIWKIQDSRFTNRFSTSAWSKRLEIRFRGISRSSTLIRSASRTTS